MMSDVLATLAAVYAALARYDEAKPLFERSLALIEHHLGPDSASLAYVLLAQASALHKLERGAEAEPLLNRAIAIQEHAGISPAERTEAYSLRRKARGTTSDAARPWPICGGRSSWPKSREGTSRAPSGNGQACSPGSWKCLKRWSSGRRSWAM